LAGFFQKIVGQKTIYLVVLSKSLRLSGEYLRKETRYRQSVNDIGIYEGSPTPSRNFVNFAPQTA